MNSNNSGCLIIAEIGQSHDGSVDLAHAYIDAIADTNADAVKFQMHIASEESTTDDQFRTKFGYNDETRYQYWSRMEFTDSEWTSLSKHVADRGLLFLCSPFSRRSLKKLISLEIGAIKVASGEIANSELFETVLASGLPIYLSTGMSSWDEIARAITLLVNNNTSVTLMQCTSLYPTPYSKVGLNVIDELRQRFNVPVGLSDHSGTLFPSLAAIARGVVAVEVHVTLDRRMPGPDVSSSITVDQLAFLVSYKEAVLEIDSNQVNKDDMASELFNMRDLFFRSVAPASDLKAGVVLTRDLLTLKKPGTGISGDEMDNLIGRRLNTNVSSQNLLKWENLDE